jgi:hypothetical protein
MKKLIALSSALALGLTVAACDGPKENAAEDAGEQAAEATNAAAEAAADAGQITDQQADAMTDQAGTAGPAATTTPAAQ